MTATFAMESCINRLVLSGSSNVPAHIGGREEKITCLPDSLTNYPEALKYLLIILGLHVTGLLAPMWKTSNG